MWRTRTRVTTVQHGRGVLSSLGHTPERQHPGGWIASGGDNLFHVLTCRYRTWKELNATSC
jgi:hypothetical protein